MHDLLIKWLILYRKENLPLYIVFVKRKIETPSKKINGLNSCYFSVRKWVLSMRKLDEFVKSLYSVIARSSAFAGRRSNLVFSGTYKNKIASLALAMTIP